jgi:hypothetical protein
MVNSYLRTQEANNALYTEHASGNGQCRTQMWCNKLTTVTNFDRSDLRSLMIWENI